VGFRPISTSGKRALTLAIMELAHLGTPDTFSTCCDRDSSRHDSSSFDFKDLIFSSSDSSYEAYKCRSHFIVLNPLSHIRIYL